MGTNILGDSPTPLIRLDENLVNVEVGTQAPILRSGDEKAEKTVISEAYMIG